MPYLCYRDCRETVPDAVGIFMEKAVMAVANVTQQVRIHLAPIRTLVPALIMIRL